jgi:hypothetical protein
VPYQAFAQRWHDFYIVAGTSAATLVGLLFVGLSLHLRVVVSSSEVRSLARVTLANFGLVLFVSLFMVIREGSSAASAQLLASGGFSLIIMTPSVLHAGRSQTRSLQLLRLMLRLGLSVLSCIGVIVAGALVAHRSFGSSLSLLVAAVVVLLMVSLRNSWDLLVTVGESALRAEATD